MKAFEVSTKSGDQYPALQGALSDALAPLVPKTPRQPPPSFLATVVAPSLPTLPREVDWAEVVDYTRALEAQLRALGVAPPTRPTSLGQY